jgi:hypothetical protein
MWSLRKRTVAAAAALTLLCLLACSRSGAPASSSDIVIPQCVANGQMPTVAGPIPSVRPGDVSRNYPWLASNDDLASRGYIEEEYFLCGVAPIGNYTTRLIVRRPKSSAAFNGTVMVEWLNVTFDYDFDALWQLSRDHIMSKGYAYVGVSAQRTGIYATPNGLQAWSPKRYAQLTIPQGSALDGSFVFDPAAYTIYGDALKAIKRPSTIDLMGGLPVKKIVATGGSQSGGTITLYYDLYQLVDQVADGFMPFILSVSSLLAALGYDNQVNVNIPTLTALVGKPVFLVNSETDPSFVRPPDSNLFRLWEVAGASHLDEYSVDESLRPILLRDLGTDIEDGDKACTYTPRSRIPFRYVMNAAMDHLQDWLTTGTLPPSGEPFQYDALGQLQRDSYGNVLGGIRLSQHEVATALNRRENPGCDLEGQYQPFDAATLRSLYPTHAQYVSRITAVTQENLDKGYITDVDAQSTRTAAQTADIPP